MRQMDENRNQKFNSSSIHDWNTLTTSDYRSRESGQTKLLPKPD